jgi:MinD-like ATPase involved in chromosome partitioning or flagellar assembly
MIVVVRSLRGSPGATTVALGVAAALEAGVYIEADCDGGVVAARYGVPREPGVITLAADHADVVDLAGHGQVLPGGLLVLPGPEVATHAMRLWERVGDRVAGALRGSARTAVVDVGRGGQRSPSHRSLERLADLELVVVRPIRDQLVALSTIDAAGSRGAPCGVVVVGRGPYQPGEIEEVTRLPVLGVVADDRRAADALTEGASANRFSRSPLARSLVSLADAVVDRIAPALAEASR